MYLWTSLTICQNKYFNQVNKYKYILEYYVYFKMETRRMATLWDDISISHTMKNPILPYWLLQDTNKIHLDVIEVLHYLSAHTKEGEVLVTHLREQQIFLEGNKDV